MTTVCNFFFGPDFIISKMGNIFFNSENTMGNTYYYFAFSIFVFQLDTITRISYLHDRSYKSVNFGEDLIKEMLFSSVCRIPLSAKSTMTAYRLMIQRVINYHFAMEYISCLFTFFCFFNRYTKWLLLLIHSVN